MMQQHVEYMQRMEINTEKTIKIKIICFKNRLQCTLHETEQQHMRTGETRYYKNQAAIKYGY